MIRLTKSIEELTKYLLGFKLKLKNIPVFAQRNNNVIHVYLRSKIKRNMIDILVEDMRAAIEELLEERGYSAQNLIIDLPKSKEIIIRIRTGLQVDKDGELVPVSEDSEEDQEDFEPLVDDEFEDNE